jgi:hypothetical protein
MALTLQYGKISVWIILSYVTFLRLYGPLLPLCIWTTMLLSGYRFKKTEWVGVLERVYLSCRAEIWGL